MSSPTKKEYLNQIRSRYLQSTKDEKKKILNEFCEVCGYNRKYAIRLLFPVVGVFPKGCLWYHQQLNDLILNQ